MRLPKFLDRLANRLGYMKQVNLTGGLGSFSMFATAPRKQTDYLGAFKSWVYPCVKARAQDTSRVNLRLYRVTDRKSGETEEVTDHEVLSLLRSVNPWMTRRQLIEYTQAYKDLAGEAFWYLVRNGKDGRGKITQIWLLRPDWITINTDPAAFLKGYTYRPPGGDAIEIPPEQIIHHKEFNPTDPYRGLSIIKAAATTIDKEMFAEEYQRKFYQNSAVPSVVLQTEQKLDDSIIKRMREQWYAEYGGIEKAHRVAILEGGLEIQPFSVSQKDMELVATAGYDRDKILALFETPKSRLGMTDGVTVSNAEATDAIFAKTVRGLMEKFVDTLNEFLLPQYAGGEELFFGFDDPVPENVEAKLKRVQTAFSLGAMTSNEVRQELGLDMVDGLDSFFLPFNLTRVEDIGSEDEEPVKGLRVRKARVVIPSMTIRAHIREEVSQKVSDAVVKSIRDTVKANEQDRADDQLGDMKAHYTEEQQEHYWKMVVAKSINFEASYARRLKENFERQEKETIHRLHSTQKALSPRDADKILFRLSTENEIVGQLMLPVIRQILEDAGNDALDFVGIEERAFDTSTGAMREFLKRDALKGIKHMNKITRSKLRKLLAVAVNDGLGIPDIAKQIREVFVEANSVRAEMIARTEVAKAQNHATVEAYKQSNVVVGKQWFTALDERVCQWCGPMQGRTKALDTPYFHEGESFLGKEGGTLSLDFEEIGSPPLHPNCRCVIIPITRR